MYHVALFFPFSRRLNIKTQSFLFTALLLLVTSITFVRHSWTFWLTTSTTNMVLSFVYFTELFSSREQFRHSQPFTKGFLVNFQRTLANPGNNTTMTIIMAVSVPVCVRVLGAITGTSEMVVSSLYWSPSPMNPVPSAFLQLFSAFLVYHDPAWIAIVHGRVLLQLFTCLHCFLHIYRAFSHNTMTVTL